MHDIDDVCEQFRHWRQKYNSVRLLEALGMKTPAEVYIPSDGSYRKNHPVGVRRRVPCDQGEQLGYVRFDKWQIYLSQTMIDQYIEFRPNPDGESFSACFRNFGSAELKIENGELIHRNIARL